MSGSPINWRNKYTASDGTIKDPKKELTRLEDLARCLCWKKIKGKGPNARPSGYWVLSGSPIVSVIVAPVSIKVDLEETEGMLGVTLIRAQRMYDVFCNLTKSKPKFYWALLLS